MNVGESVIFSYTGNIQSLPIDTSGYYQLEVWGAQGGTVSGNFPHNSSTYYGGRGGYVLGYKKLKEGDIIYICIGNKPADTTKDNIWNYNWSVSGGYNGGGGGGGRVASADDPYDLMYRAMGAGGGATHMALNSNRGVLSQYNSYRNEILLVAGGGAGAYKHYYYSTGVSGQGNGNDSGGGGGSFGQGSGWSDSVLRGGGGGGYIGGSSGNGGTNNVDNVPAIRFGGELHEPVIQNGQRDGNGQAKITFLKKAIEIYQGDIEADALYVGDNEVDSIYFGDTEA